MEKIKRYWSHDGPPSHYHVEVDGELAFRGSYAQAMLFIKSLDNDGMISFKEDFIPYADTLGKRYYRALMCERELRREIIKLKKDLKKYEEQ